MTMATDGTIGAVFSAETEARFALGHRIKADNGQEYVYVQAAQAISQYDFVTFDNGFATSPLMKANADLGHGVGVSQVALAADEYGFVAVNGMSLLGNVTLSALPGRFVATSASTGRVTTSGTSQTEIQGVTLLTTAGATATAVGVLLNNPHVDL